MPIKNRATLAISALVLAAMQALGESSAIELEALLGDTAVLMIDGQRKTLRVGQSHAGITLVAVQRTEAMLDINGQAETVGLSRRVSTNFQQQDEQVVTIPRDAMMKYETSALINGHSALVMVDTGANMVAMSSEQARAMNIDYSAGTPTNVETASGLTSAYAITLQSVTIGGIQVDNVPAMVVEGAYPGTILLGMSFLRHVKLQEHNGILSLSRNQ